MISIIEILGYSLKGYNIKCEIIAFTRIKLVLNHLAYKFVLSTKIRKEQVCIDRDKIMKPLSNMILLKTNATI